MNQRVPDNQNDPDQVGRWIAEAGRPDVEPRAEHVEHVRALLLDRADSMRPRTFLALFDEDEEEDSSHSEGDATAVEGLRNELMDDSKPSDAAKQAEKLQLKQAAADPARAAFKETSDAAGEILRRLLERRRAEKSP